MRRSTVTYLLILVFLPVVAASLLFGCGGSGTEEEVAQPGGGDFTSYEEAYRFDYNLSLIHI